MLKWLIFSQLIFPQTSLDWLQLYFEQQRTQQQRMAQIEQQRAQLKNIKCFILAGKLRKDLERLIKYGPDIVDAAAVKNARTDAKIWLKECN